MHRILTALLAVVSVIGGWLAFDYHSRLAARDTQIAALTAERDAARAAEKAALAGVDPLKENIERLTRERDRLLAQAKMANPADSPPGGPTPPRGPGGMEGRPNLNGLAAMLSTPEGKKMFQAQSANVVRNQYSELAKRMKLSPQDTTVLMGLLADRQTALATVFICCAVLCCVIYVLVCATYCFKHIDTYLLRSGSVEDKILCFNMKDCIICMHACKHVVVLQSTK